MCDNEGLLPWLTRMERKVSTEVTGVIRNKYSRHTNGVGKFIGLHVSTNNIPQLGDVGGLNYNSAVLVSKKKDVEIFFNGTTDKDFEQSMRNALRCAQIIFAIASE